MQHIDLETRQAQANALFQSIGEGAIATDDHGRITNINQVALDLLGLTQEESLGAWFPKLIEAQDERGNHIDVFERPITRAFRSGKTVSTKTFYKLQDDTVLPVAITVSPIMLNGQVMGAIEVFRDVTLEHNIDKMKSEFISIASHQLRTPLSAIKTYAHLLAEGYVGPISEQQSELMEIIMTSIGRMNELIDTLLDISKIERGKLGLNIQTANISRLLEEITTEMDQHAKNKHITFSCKLEQGLSTDTDPLLVKEVFANLLSNSIKYTPLRGQVSVTLKRVANQIVAEVKDDGYGIPKNSQDRIFTKFFRAPNVIEKETWGTGLGLYMVKSIVDNLGGKVWFTSKEGAGSSFYFSLPITTTKRRQRAVMSANTMNHER
jgi:PAS domain S-box-containing protein